MSRPIGIDLFAGAGGLSLGFEQAGFDVVAAVEIDPIHAAVHAFNFPLCKVIAKSVTTLTGHQIRLEAGIGKKPVEVVFGGAPCQGFSLIGRRALDDPRNALVKDFVRLVRELDANYFVFENVKGITVGKHAAFLKELIEAFEDAGYTVRLPWKVLNAASFGTPQNRERLILMGCKNGLTVPEYPVPTTRPAGSKSGDSLLPFGPTCKDALGDLPNPESYDALWNSDEVSARWAKPSAYAATLRGEAEGANYFGYDRKWNPKLLTSSMRTEHTELSKTRFAATQPGAVEPVSRFFRLPPDGVSNTLRAGTDSARGAFTSPRPIHYSEARCITVREMARLHGFPDWFRLHRTKWHGARQIGNAVPPPLARAVATQIMSAAGCMPAKPSFSVDLGSKSLLQLDMGEAAALFGIEVPIAQRLRKESRGQNDQDSSDTSNGRNKFIKSVA